MQGKKVISVVITHIQFLPIGKPFHSGSKRENSPETSMLILPALEQECLLAGTKKNCLGNSI